jgi:hypothetical protein
VAEAAADGALAVAGFFTFLALAAFEDPGDVAEDSIKIEWSRCVAPAGAVAARTASASETPNTLPGQRFSSTAAGRANSVARNVTSSATAHSRNSRRHEMQYEGLFLSAQ